MWYVATDITVVWASSLSGPWLPQIYYNEVSPVLLTLAGCCNNQTSQCCAARCSSISTSLQGRVLDLLFSCFVPIREVNNAMQRALQDLKAWSGEAVDPVNSRIYCKTVSTRSNVKITGNMSRAGEMAQEVVKSDDPDRRPWFDSQDPYNGD